MTVDRKTYFVKIGYPARNRIALVSVDLVLPTGHPAIEAAIEKIAKGDAEEADWLRDQVKAGKFYVEERI